MSSQLPERPILHSIASEQEFARWYWTKNELATECRRRELAASGSKHDLAARISAHLAGRAQPAVAKSAAASKQLAEPLSALSVIPRGQRCSQIVRVWLTAQIGPQFHFDAEMREFIAESDGTRTLGEVVEHWKLTRQQPKREIGAQFELNRFTREWHACNPNGSHGEALAAWQAHRALPVELR